MNPTAEPAAAAPAHLGLRVLALLYDMLPLLALWFIATVLALALTGGTLDVQRLPHKLLMQALMLGATAAYLIPSWRRGGQTIGMKPWRLRIVCADGSQPNSRQLLLRFAVAMISIAGLGAGFLWALFDRQKRTWHDMAAGTLMVQLGNIRE